ncbi:M1 family metallopeptidase [Croceivirga thetidis]|uniref:Aminopeptidase N n=1 Tax=Croceivirga thetidis TaxID=2721623 RepID=A0ABX1GTR4_9FLAO|nr:M1 family metallopeptidase [Croceivirga thetidis]NKI32441.1 M1 family metallopeptidase [Croceivirga thetidis]
MRFFLLFALFCFSFSFSQRQESIDFTTANVKIKRLKKGYINGSVSYRFHVLKDVDSIFLNANNMAFSSVVLNKKPFDYKYFDNKIRVYHDFKKGETYHLFLKFAAFPKQTVYFLERDSWFSLKKEKDNSKGQVWTQGQGKYTSHWLPSLDDMNDKIEFDLTIRAAPQFEVIANGNLKSSDTLDFFHNYWRYDMTKPMSSYLVAFVIGDFEKKVLKSKSGVPLELYYEPKDSLKFEPTYRYSREIFDFLEQEIGVEYPWQNYKQVPVQDFLYAGMENTSCTIFSNQFVIDSTAFVDKNYINVNAHELAHQWFGNLVTEVSGEHHWLHEGFATYYAYLAEKELFGEDHFYWKLYDTAKTLHQLSEDGQGEALTDPGAGSLTFYEKGAWALVMLRERVGDSNFKKGIKSYLKTYAFKNATISDFLNEIQNASGINLENFQKIWLESAEFPWQEVKWLLEQKSQQVKNFLFVKKIYSNQTESEADYWVDSYWNNASDEFKKHCILEFEEQIPNTRLKEIIQEESLIVRQAVAIAMPKFPNALQEEFESLLTDKSYVTQETTLFKLWEAFPANRSKYLKQMDGVVGLPNKNVRQLWLTLALVTPEFEPERKKEFYDELNDFTLPKHNFEVRQLAFQYLSQIQALSDKSIKNLVLALDHHAWQFKKSSRNLIRQLYNTPEGKMRFEQLEKQWPEESQQNFQKVINP